MTAQELPPSYFRHQSLQLPILLGVAHGMVDAASGFLLGRLPHTVPLEQVALLIVAYNMLAFGCQPLFGLVSDRLRCPRLMVWIGLVGLSAAVLLVPQQTELAIALAGLSSAAFHVGGGALSYWATPEQTTGTSLFVAPGVVGLAIGGVLGFGQYEVAAVLAGLLLGVAVAIASVRLPALPDASPTNVIKAPTSEAAQETAVLLLIVAIALGSMVWTGSQLWLLGQAAWIIGTAIAAAVGKLIGGWLAQRWGWRRWTVTALAIAALLLATGNTPLQLLLGMACLQSVVPVTLAATIRLMPQHSATAAGFALGLGILLGGIPVLAGFSLFPQAIAAVIGVLAGAAIALWHGLRPSSLATPRSTTIPHSIAIRADAKQG
ncbi:MFS transporter [Oscillatoria sp. FACHB-1407]|uniref:MFS transporter n=1 Tax=Oscillatoria sp. FACHB-1407 TaxID=2692847 RepID=UPI001685FFBD|nr:MFS transporter [Oscillatoria sp. FACHB-1407]MBD2465821.1 MFS transporter [Oscillatoria sp. FACHB-1407]